jgi:uncharacterized repeat protein (TIGR03803 family)
MSCPRQHRVRISSIRLLGASAALGLALVLVLAVVAPRSAKAQTYTVLHKFVRTDGAAPWKGLTRDAKGNFYGATSQGGGFGQGAIFKLDKNGTFTVLYRFTGGADGGVPLTYLNLDNAGNLYGTTAQGGNLTCDYLGSRGCGTVFELTPHSGGSWTETVRYAFGEKPDGEGPSAGLVRDPAGNFYGTTIWGGNPACTSGLGCGTVFELTPHSGGSWTETVQYTFTGSTDGANPAANLIRDPAGNLYGTTRMGRLFQLRIRLWYGVRALA